MLKLMLSIWCGVTVICIGVTVLYWRDTHFEPVLKDILIFLGCLPFAITCFVLCPIVITKWFRQRSSENIIQKPGVESPLAVEAEDIQPEIQWSRINVYAARALHAFGEQQEILDGIRQMQAPSLDTFLLNVQGNPVLSYRISVADSEDDMDDARIENELQDRLSRLIRLQIVEYGAELTQIAEHMRASDLFHTGRTAHEYRIHPGWTNPSTEYDDDHTFATIIPVAKLSRLHIHVILRENFRNQWNEVAAAELIHSEILTLGMQKQHIEIEHYYWNSETGYAQWYELLQTAGQDTEKMHLVLAFDSDMVQASVDELLWLNEHNIPSEFACSCLISAVWPEQEVLATEKQIIVSRNTLSTAESPRMAECHADGDVEQSCVFVLNDIRKKGVVQQIEQKFRTSAFEDCEYIYVQTGLGGTVQLADIYGFILALNGQAKLSAVFSVDHADIQSFILRNKAVA